MVTAYPVHRKAKSFDICSAFVQGCGGSVSVGPQTLYDGPAFFWGVDESNVEIWKAAKTRGDYFYGDNSYFDGARGEYFRVTYNRLQHTGVGHSTGERFARLKVGISMNRLDGEHIVVCPQSVPFMRDVVGYDGDWLQQTVEQLTELTERKIIVRPWNRDKAKASGTLWDDLDNAHALVTWSSAAAVSATLWAIPAICGGDCAAVTVGGSDLSYIERPILAPYADRMQWAAVLADNQWTLEEMRSGQCWAQLQPEKVAA
jgi:hypothetical protein